MEPGSRVGRYELRRELGRGGMGEVWLAHDPETGRDVALKVGLEAATDEAGRARFEREAQALAQLRHSRIVAIHEVGEVDGRPFLVMDLIEGRPLDGVMRQRGLLEPARAARLAADVASGLAHAHERGIFHRDVKPANVIVTPDGRALLTDFGLAKPLGSESLTEPGMLVGTLFYMAPEQLAGRDVDGRADQYALGTTLYEALCGQTPFRADAPITLITMVLEREPEPPSRLRPDLPADLDAIVLKCLAKAPADRYPDAAHLAEDLERFLDGAPVHARERGDRKTQALAWGRAAAVAVAVVALALTLGWLTRVRPQQVARGELAAIRAWRAEAVAPWGLGLAPGGAANAPSVDAVASKAARLRELEEVLGVAEVGAELVAELEGAERLLKLQGGAPVDPPAGRAEAVETASEAVADALLFVHRGELEEARERLARAFALRPGYPPAEVLALRLLAEDDPSAFMTQAVQRSGWVAEEARRQYPAASAEWLKRLVLAGSVPAAKQAMLRVAQVGEELGLPASAAASAKREAFERVAGAWTERVEQAGGVGPWSWELAAYEGWTTLMLAPPRCAPGPKLKEAARLAVRRHFKAFDRATAQGGMGQAAIDAVVRLVQVDELAYYGLGWRGPRGERFGRALEAARAVNTPEERVRFLLATLRAGLSIWASDAASHVSHAELEGHAQRFPESQAVRYARFLTVYRRGEPSIRDRLVALRQVVVAAEADLAPIYVGRVWREIATILKVRITEDPSYRTPEHGRELIDAVRKARAGLLEGDRRLLQTYGYMRRHGWLQEGYKQQAEALELLGPKTERAVLEVWEDAVRVFEARLKAANDRGADPGYDLIHLAYARTRLARELKRLGDPRWRPRLEAVAREVDAISSLREPGVHAMRLEVRKWIDVLLGKRER